MNVFIAAHKLFYGEKAHFMFIFSRISFSFSFAPARSAFSIELMPDNKAWHLFGRKDRNENGPKNSLFRVRHHFTFSLAFHRFPPK